jgi:hypothetical protein
MHSKSHKICTLKFLRCYLAQRVHGSKVEAKELTENSKALNWMSWNQIHSVGWSDTPLLTHVGWVLQPTNSKWTVGWTDGAGISSSDALGFGYNSGQGSALKHRMIRCLDHRFIWRLHLNSTVTHQDFCFSTRWTDAWIGDINSSPDALIQIIQYRPKCGAFNTGWSDGASVYCLGFKVQQLYWLLLVTEWSDAQQGGTIGSSDGTTFSGDFFQRLAFFARPINKPPASLELPLPLWRSIAA